MIKIWRQFYAKSCQALDGVETDILLYGRKWSVTQYYEWPLLCGNEL